MIVLVVCLSLGLGAAFRVPEDLQPLVSSLSRQQFIIHQDSVISMVPVQGGHHETTTAGRDHESVDRRQASRRGDSHRETTTDHDTADRRQPARRGDSHRETTDHDTADRRQPARRGDDHRGTTPDHDSADRRQPARRGDRPDPLFLTTHGDHAGDQAKVTPIPAQPIHPFESLL